jgi:hypothetical protein
MKAMICLACLAVAAAGTGRLIFPAKSSPTQPKLVKTHTVRVVDTTPFRVRWEPVADVAPVQDQSRELKEVPVRTVAITQPRDLSMYREKERDVREPELREPARSPQRRMRTIRYASTDICTRHRMHKVYTNGGRSWRCRR